MKAKNLLGIFAAVLALVFILPAVNSQAPQTFGTIEYVVVDTSEILYGGETVALFADDTLDLRVVFKSANNNGEVEKDVRMTARVLGELGIVDYTGRFDVIQDGRTYSKQLSLQLPTNIDPTEDFVLEVTVESNSEQADELTAILSIQRESYNLEILSVEADSTVNAGGNFALDVVLKNRGRQESIDTFVEVRIPELGISDRIFLGDLSPEDQSDPDKYDSAQGRLWLKIPTDAQSGLYTIEIEAFSDDFETTATKRIEVLSSGAMSNVITSSTAKDFAVGEEVTYSFTIVNSGQRIKVYNLIQEVDDGLTIDLEESVVAVPAGSSKTVRVTAMASREGNYNFNVNVHSSEGELIGMQEFVANVEGKAASVGSTAVVLTIVLAIIFVVLLIVLIVLLTRKPEKSEEFGNESYY